MKISDKTLNSLLDDIYKQKNEFIEQADLMPKAIFKTIVTFQEPAEDISEEDIYDLDFYEVSIIINRMWHDEDEIEGEEDE